MTPISWPTAGCARPTRLEDLIDDNQAADPPADRGDPGADRPAHDPQPDCQAVCARYQLFTRKPRRALRFERNVRFFVEYLLDEGQLELTCRRGVAYYCRPSAQ